MILMVLYVSLSNESGESEYRDEDVEDSERDREKNPAQPAERLPGKEEELELKEEKLKRGVDVIEKKNDCENVKRGISRTETRLLSW